MSDGLHNGIDLDKLVNALLRDKEAKAAASTAESSPEPVSTEPSVTPPVPSGVPPVTPRTEELLITQEPVPEATPPVQENLPLVTARATDDDMPDEDEDVVDAGLPLVDEDEPPMKKPRRGLFGWLHRDKEPKEDLYEEEWADWGLETIGSYYAEKEPTDLPPVPAGAVFVETDEDYHAEPVLDTPQPIEETAEIFSGRVDMADDEPTPPTAESEPPTPLASSVDEAATVVMPAVRPQAPASSMEFTRVIELTPRAKAPTEVAPLPTVEPSTDAHLPDQLSLEELVRVEDIDDASASTDEEHEDPAVRLQRAREEKIKEFVFDGDEEEENEPEEEVVEETEEPEIEDFTGYETTDAVRLELQYRRRTSLVGLLLTGGLELLLLLLTLITVNVGYSPITSIGYLTVHVFCLILMAVLNYSSIARGLSGLFMLKANSDSTPAVALLAALCGTAVHFVNMDVALPAFAPLAGLLMLFGALAQFVKTVRISDNFAFVSYDGDKYAAGLIEDEKTLQEIGRRVSMDEHVDVTYFRRTSFLSSYLANAYEEDGGDRFARVASPLTMLASLVLSLFLLATGALDGFWVWLSTFLFMLCLSSFAMQMALQLPLKAACRRMLRRGGFLVGWNAVDAFGKPDALTVDVADLYPDESMLLHGIKTFSGMHIDAAILDAASLSIRAGGPLSQIFRRIIQNQEELLREVDSLAYEQGMGLSGWVDGRRVLVGNRRLLQNHDVDVPSLDYEARYAKDGRRLVYLSTSGMLSGMFVVSYLPDEEIGDALHDLCRSRVSLLVRSNDPNITAESLCADFDLDEYYVDVLPAVAGRMYDKLMAEEVPQTPALLASNGHILGTAMVLAACRMLRKKSTLVFVLAVLTALAGLGICVPWALNAIGSYFMPAFAFMLGAAFLGWFIPLFRR